LENAVALNRRVMRPLEDKTRDDRSGRCFVRELREPRHRAPGGRDNIRMTGKRCAMAPCCRIRGNS